MKELAVVERYLYGRLRPITQDHGWPLPQIAPFDVTDGPVGGAAFAAPVVYFRTMATGDRGAIGPGARILTWAEYEVGVFHDQNTLGASLPSALMHGHTVSLLAVLSFIDDALQNYAPVSDPAMGGTVYSVQRMYSVRLAERDGAKLYRRDGGVYRLHVEAH